jgi:5-formyltetrahydrofolate cyclo-ligase
VPGLAFGRGGERVGKGGGYFDRFLSHAASPLRIGICPEKLLFEELPLRPWDQRMDIILTEAGAWDVPRREFLKSGVAPRNQLR